MKKLSLFKVLKEAQKDLEDWSANLETDPVERAAQKGASMKMPTNVQKVWGDPPVSDVMIVDPEQLEYRYKLNPSDLERVSLGDFSSVVGKVGDLGNFAEDVASVFGSEIADKINNFMRPLPSQAPMRQASSSEMSLSKALPPPPTKDVPAAHQPTMLSKPAINTPTRAQLPQTKPRIKLPQNR